MTGKNTRGTDPRADREPRSYPHGTGDRNAWATTGEDRMPIHEGGTQRQAPPAPEAGPERPPRKRQ